MISVTDTTVVVRMSEGLKWLSEDRVVEAPSMAELLLKVCKNEDEETRTDSAAKYVYANGRNMLNHKESVIDKVVDH